MNLALDDHGQMCDTIRDNGASDGAGRSAVVHHERGFRRLFLVRICCGIYMLRNQCMGQSGSEGESAREGSKGGINNGPGHSHPSPLRARDLGLQGLMRLMPG